MSGPSLLALLALPATLLAADANEAVFRDRILPVLQANCASCHGGASPAAALSMASLDSVLQGGKHGAALEPGRASASLIIQYIKGEKSPRMPMGGSLPAATLVTLEKAIGEMKPVPMVVAGRPPHAQWVLTRPQSPAVPATKVKDWATNPIDSFVLAKLEAKGMSPAPPASRRALIRRVYFDLIGLPPSPDEVEQFLSDTAPDAYEKLIDRLLADTRYGERWGRHWLDLVRFAESDGFAIDSERPTAWRYRDYVIRSFNKDKPYDLFIKEQLSGDELNDKRSAPEDRSERMVALGFLRMGTWEADANFKTQLRQDWLNEITGTTSLVFLGLTTGCARCHNHKYDPIPQRDFYRLQAFFAATRTDEANAPFLPSENPKRMKQLLRQREDEAEAAAEEFKQLEAKLKQKYVDAGKDEGDYQKALKDKNDPAYTAEERQAHTEASDKARRISESAPRYHPVAYSVAEVVPPAVPEVAATYVLAGGEMANRSEKVEPGFLECITGKSEPAMIPFARGSGRRTALADWIASPSNPLAARVIVNRIWQHHFGEGIVRTPSDFGMNGERPTHPELLDWLATEFVEKKWSIKAMHKLMLTTSSYRQSTEHPQSAQFAAADPANQLLWRMNWMRLESEVLRDSILAVSGRLEKAAGGPGVFLDVPADLAEGFNFFKWFPSEEKEQNRRSIYTFQRRSLVMPMMEVFDTANMSESCSRRNVTTVAPQAFALLNSEFVNRESRHLLERARELAGPDRDRQIDRAFRLALARPPSASELEKARTLADPARLGAVLFNLNEFLYLD